MFQGHKILILNITISTPQFTKANLSKKIRFNTQACLLLLFRMLVLSRLRLHINWFKVVPKTVSGPF